MEKGPQFLYHGTNADLEPGTILQTGAQREKTAHDYSTHKTEQSRDHINYSFATENKDMAEHYAGNAAEKLGGDPKIYLVEPLGDHERVGKSSNFRSKKGFKVVKRHR